MFDVIMTGIDIHVNLCTKVGSLFCRSIAGWTEAGSLEMFDEVPFVMAKAGRWQICAQNNNRRASTAAWKSRIDDATNNTPTSSGTINKGLGFCNSIRCNV